MIRLILSGACGRMGRMVAQEAQAQGMQVVAGIDRPDAKPDGFPLYPHLSACKEAADVLIDFSSPALLPDLLKDAVKKGLPCVLGTTGYTDHDLALIKDAALKIPIFQSPNMSLGVYVLKRLAGEAARMLPGFDIEIVEKHHNKKADSPSGTALALLDAVKGPDSQPVFGRHGLNTKRNKQEIGVHAVRGGSVAGEHELGFYGENEVILLTHAAQSRAVFASGAVAAAQWLLNQPAGLYHMAHLMGDA